MRRWLTALVLTGAVTLTLAGCARPDGVDGELTDDWPAFAVPGPFQPVAGTCHLNEFAPAPPLSAHRPVDCAEKHRLETVHVGAFTGATAARPAAPRAGSAEMRAAYADCDAKAREFVGDEWRSGRLWLGVATPTPTAWSGGARWYRCDLQEIAWTKGTPVPVDRAGSLNGALASADSPLRLGCFTVTLSRLGKVDTMLPGACTKQHNGEFAGVWTAPPDADYPTRDQDWLPYYEGCYQRVAAYAKLPRDRNLRARTGVVTVPGSAADWAAGDRGVRCYLWVRDARFTRSLKDAGPSGLPLRTN